MFHFDDFHPEGQSRFVLLIKSGQKNECFRSVKRILKFLQTCKYVYDTPKRISLQLWSCSLFDTIYASVCQTEGGVLTVCQTNKQIFYWTFIWLTHRNKTKFLRYFSIQLTIRQVDTFSMFKWKHVYFTFFHCWWFFHANLIYLHSSIIPFILWFFIVTCVIVFLFLFISFSLPFIVVTTYFHWSNFDRE